MKKKNFLTLPFILTVWLLIAAQFSGVTAQNADEFYRNKRYDQVLKIIDAEIEKNKNADAQTQADLYFIRGSSRYELIYNARTQTMLGSYAPVAPERGTFERRFPPEVIKTLDGAIADLEKAFGLYQSIPLISTSNANEAGAVLATKISREREMLKYQALAQLEKAQFVTNKQSDFEKAADLLQKRDNTVNPLYDDPRTRWLKEGFLLAAELRADVGKNSLSAATDRYRLWRLAGYDYLKNEIALPALVEAFDLTGNYARSRASLLSSAIAQIQKDGAIFIPANQKINRAAMRSHLLNVQFASQLSTDAKLLPFARARLVGTLVLRGKLTLAEVDFVKNAETTMWAQDTELAPADTRIFVARTKIESGSGAEKAAALEKVAGILKVSPTDVPARVARAYAKYSGGDFAGAEADLTAAIAGDPALAFAHDAHALRGSVYQKLGKPELAAKDEQEAMQFQRILQALAAQP